MTVTPITQAGLADWLETDLPDVEIDVRLAPDEADKALHLVLSRGLRAKSKALPVSWLREDDAELGDGPLSARANSGPTTSQERALLAAHATRIANAALAVTIVDLASTESARSRALVAACWQAGTLRTYVPFDANDAALAGASLDLAHEFPGLAVRAICGELEHHLRDLPAGGPRLCALLGGEIGSFVGVARAKLLRSIRAALEPGDFVVITAELDRHVEHGRDRELADASRRVLSTLNRRLDADFDATAFEPIVRWDETNEWVETSLRSLKNQAVHVGALGLTATFDEGELLRVERRAKFTPERLRRELAGAQIEVDALETDPAGTIALVIGRAV